MKKSKLLSIVIAFGIALVIVYAHAEIDQRDFDGDGDIDGNDLSVFTEKFGSIIWYKDFDGDLFSDGNTQYSISQPLDYYPESELTATAGDCDDEDENVNPGKDEICDDGLDNNCDGEVDNGCGQCTSGQSESCYTGDPGTQNVGECLSGIRTCLNGAWDPCVGEVLPEAEICDGLDNNCDGQVDEGNVCCGTDPIPSGGECPIECTGGCGPQGNICVIICDGPDECSSSAIDCPPGFSCQIECLGENACSAVTINCPDDYRCEVSCAGLNSCSDALINCGNDVCSANCANSNSNLSLNCGNSCNCVDGCP